MTEWTDGDKIRYLLELAAKQSGEIGRLQGMLEAHLIYDHKYDPKRFERKPKGVASK